MKTRAIFFSLIASILPAAWAGTWTTTPWTNDASTGISSAKTVWAYNIGSAASPVVNGVLFTGVAGGNPSAAGKFSITGPDSVINGHVNELTDLSGSGSAGLGADFIYNGFPATVTVEGLVTGGTYTVSTFGAAWDWPDPRVATFESGGDTINVDENGLGAGKGIRVDYTFTATAATRTITVTPATASSFHFYAIALQREPLIVTNTTDTAAGSLRHTVDNALPGAVIQFDPSLSGQTITLGTRIQTSVTGLTIDGSTLPKSVRISGNNNSRVFRVPGTKLTLISLVLEKGSFPTGSGGAIVNENGELTVKGCTFLNNTAQRGGAISSDTASSFGAFTSLINCTFSGNTATVAGGAFDNKDGEALVQHCTISGNSAPAGGGVAGSAALSSLTYFDHSIIHGNSGGDLDLSVPATVTFQSNGANFIGGGDGVAEFVEAHDQVGTDPQLQPLADYGGPVPTMLTFTESPAIDIPLPSITLDQRGFARDGFADSGAIERGPIVFVTNTNDSGPGSLRDVLDAVTVPDTGIWFEPGLDGQTITLTSGHLQVWTHQNIEIDASRLPAGITIRNGGSSRVIHNNPGILGLTRVTLADGSDVDGGGLLSLGHIHATDCTFRDCDTAGSGGGAFLFGGRADFLRCAFTGNSAGHGGAIWQGGDGIVNLTNCTVSGNSCNDASGTGGIYLSEGAHRLHHVTISGNHGVAQPGGLYLLGIVSVDFRGCIIAGNTTAGEPYPDLLLFGTATTSGPNLIGVNDLVTSKFPTGSLAGTGMAPLDPKLAPLANYGGHSSTMPPDTGSPALDQGSATLLAKDQRGAPRVFGAAADLGAAEYRQTLVSNADFDGAGSLRDAIASEFASTITFDAGFFNAPGPVPQISFFEPIPLAGGLIFDAANIPNRVLMDGFSAFRMFEVQPGAVVTFRRFHFRNGSSALGNDGDLTLENCYFSGNKNTNLGACIFNTGQLTVRTSEFSDNRANIAGAGIFSFGPAANVKVEDCLFAENRATAGGGAAFLFGGSGDFINTTISNNTAGTAGAGLALQDPGTTLRLIHCTLTGNLADNTGEAGGITWEPVGNSVTLENTIVAGNGNVQLAHAFTSLGQNLVAGGARLAPLGNYGGPLRTMPPLPGSPAIEGGVQLATTPALDLRGAPRPNGSLPDLGAVEAVALGSLGLPSLDGDTIPDVLEFFGGPFPHLSPFTDNTLVDTDGDGFTDAEEIADSTDPLDANSRLRITHFEITAMNPGFTATNIDFTSFPGLSYSAEISSDLDFSDARVSSLGNATGFLFQTSVYMAPTERFVRIRRNP